MIKVALFVMSAILSVAVTTLILSAMFISVWFVLATILCL